MLLDLLFSQHFELMTPFMLALASHPVRLPNLNISQVVQHQLQDAFSHQGWQMSLDLRLGEFCAHAAGSFPAEISGFILFDRGVGFCSCFRLLNNLSHFCIFDCLLLKVTLSNFQQLSEILILRNNHSKELVIADSLLPVVDL